MHEKSRKNNQNPVNSFDGLETYTRSVREREVAEREAALQAEAERLTAHVASELARIDAAVVDGNARLTAQATTAANDNAPASSVDWLNPADWQGRTAPRREWLIDSLIPMRTTTILTGDGGVGKSMLALQLSAAVAMGGTTLDMTPKPGRVLYLGAEDEADEFWRRTQAIASRLGGQPRDMAGMRIVPMAGQDATLVMPGKAAPLISTSFWTDFRAKAVAFDPVLIVFDTSANLFGGNEIDRVQVRAFVQALNGLAMEANCATLLLSHPSVAGMATGTGSSGSTAWNNTVRARYWLTETQDEDETRRLGANEQEIELRPESRRYQTLQNGGWNNRLGRRAARSPVD